MLTSSIPKWLAISLLSFLAYSPLVYVMALVPEVSDPQPVPYDRYEDGYVYTAEQLDPWLGTTICSWKSLPDVNGRRRTMEQPC